MNLVEGMLVESGSAGGAASGTLCVAFPGASVPLPAATADRVRRQRARRGARPAARVTAPEPRRARSPPPCIIVELLGRRDPRDLPHRDRAARHRAPERRRAAKPALGEAVRIAVDDDPTAFHLFDSSTGDRLGGIVTLPARRRRRRRRRERPPRPAGPPAQGGRPGLPAARSRPWCSSASSPSIPSCATSSSCSTRRRRCPASRRATSGCTRSSRPSPRPSSPRASSPRSSSWSWWCRSA